MIDGWMGKSLASAGRDRGILTSKHKHLSGQEIKQL